MKNHIYLILFLLALFETKSFAYLNPGTGSYALQLITAFLFGGIFIVKHYWANIVKAIKNLISRTNIKEKK